MTGNGCTVIRFTLRKPSSIPAVFAGPVTGQRTGNSWGLPPGVAKTTRPISPIAPSRKSLACRWRPVSASYSASYESSTAPTDRRESGRTGPDHRRWDACTAERIRWREAENGVAHSGGTGEAAVADDRENPRGAAADSQFGDGRREAISGGRAPADRTWAQWR